MMRDGMTERHVQAIWYDAALRPKRLFSRRGSEISVVSPGEWNLGAGPDFLGAVLEIGRERRRVTGDVEIHLCPADWDLHGHGSDPKYRNVIAHVTWRCGPDPASLPPGAISVWLGRFVSSNPSFSPDQIDLGAYPFARLPIGERPCKERFDGDPDAAVAALRDAGKRRLRMKARRIAGRLCAAAVRTGRSERIVRPGGAADVEPSRRQVFYEEVMTALGYSANAAQFRSIAERVPIDCMPRDAASARAALLVAGGFENWKRGSCRPGNSPERRLERAADVFTATAAMSFAGASDFSAGACRAMVSEMCGERQAAAGEIKSRCMGRGRAAAVVANVVLPCALAEERVADVPDWLPPEDVSHPVRLAAARIFGRDHNPAALYVSNGLLIQGLLQIHRDCCEPLYPDCGGCPLPQSGRRES